MAIVLGAVTLNPNMVWVDRYGWSPVLQEVLTTLEGNPVVYTATRGTRGRPITLVAAQDQGWLTKAQVDPLQIYAEEPRLVLDLTIGSEEFSVMFRHHEAPAFEFGPLIPRAVPLTGDYFAGQIKLMTV